LLLGDGDDWVHARLRVTIQTILEGKTIMGKTIKAFQSNCFADNGFAF
jgi:hypothetical protein